MSLESFANVFQELSAFGADDVVDVESGFPPPPTRSLPPKQDGWIKDYNELKPGELEEFLSGKPRKRI